MDFSRVISGIIHLTTTQCQVLQISLKLGPETQCCWKELSEETNVKENLRTKWARRGMQISFLALCQLSYQSFFIHVERNALFQNIIILLLSLPNFCQISARFLPDSPNHSSKREKEIVPKISELFF